MDLREFIEKTLLDNAIKYDGTTNANAAIGAVMREFPDKRSEKDAVLTLAGEVAEQVNALTVEQQQERLATLGGSGAPVKEQKDPFQLDFKDPILRFEPSVSGPLHIGHAFPLGLNHLLAINNDGKLILRVADTNPDNIYDQAYDMIIEDAKWFTHDGIDQVHIQSDRMPLYYQHAEHCLASGWAYVCTCEPDVFRELINGKQACPCRADPPAIQLERWELMLTSYLPGEAVMRMKTDVQHPNPAMRDWPAMRVNISKHPRHDNKYRVWPLMNFSVSVDDMDMKLTHVLRAKDHADNAKRQEYVYRYFEYPIPTVFNVGKINFTDLKLSTSETRKRIAEGDFIGWDDIRLPFLPALRRRGFQPEAFLRLAKEVGISSTDKKLSQQEYFTTVEAFNKDVIDRDADRIFFVQNPTLITVANAQEREVVRDKYPDVRKGGRTFQLGAQVLIDKNDVPTDEHTVVRLMDGYNFQKKNDTFEFLSDSLDDYQQAAKKRIVHWLPKQDDLVDVRVHMPDGSWISGKAEPTVQQYDQGTIVQFERFGFVRLDSKERMEFWFTHK